MTAGSVDALRRYRAEQSERKQLAVVQAIEELIEGGAEITVSGVSRAAGVSREFIHKHPHLHQAVRKGAKAVADRRHAADRDRSSFTSRGLRADRTTLLARVERQRGQIAELQTKVRAYELQRKRWLGSQISQGPTVDPEVHAELRITNERLMANNAALTAKVAELRRLMEILEAELAASRQAHLEDMHTGSLSRLEIPNTPR